jgi:hypothetical protein
MKSPFRRSPFRSSRPLRRRPLRRRSPFRSRPFRRRSPFRRSPFRRRIIGGNPTYAEIKEATLKIIEYYSGQCYIVGSLALALHQEMRGSAPSFPPNDIDIVLLDKIYSNITPYQKDLLRPVIGLHSTSGSKFQYIPDTTITVDILRVSEDRFYDKDIQVIEGIPCLNINGLIENYKDIVEDDWGSSPQQIQIAEQKLEILNTIK